MHQREMYSQQVYENSDNYIITVVLMQSIEIRLVSLFLSLIRIGLIRKMHYPK